MSPKEFFLSGLPDHSSTVELLSDDTIEHVLDKIAAAFGIAKTNGITLHGTGDVNVLGEAGQVRDYSGKIGVRVSGKDVGEPWSPRELPLVGNHFEIYPDHMGNHDRLFAKYGGVIKTVNMGTTIYLTNDPQVSEVVLSESEYFSKITTDPSHPLFHMKDSTALFMCNTDDPAFAVAHKFIPPSMSPKAVRRYVPCMQAATEQSFAVFDELDSLGKAFNAYHYMFKVAGQIIYRVVLGLDVGHFKSIDTKPHEIIHLLGEYMHLMKKTSLSPPWYKYLPFGDIRRLERVRTRAWGLVQDAIDNCEAEGDGKDLPIKEAALQSSCIADYLKRAVDDHGNKLPADYLLTNTVALIGAGFVTSASLLSWLLYALTQYPGTQDRLLQELVDYGATSTTSWTYDDIMAVPYLDHFVKETHRMHNPSFQTARNARRDVIVPGGWKIPAGAIVIPTFPSIHKNKDHWDNPDRFDPDRWADKDAARKRHRMAYTPFAAGPRGCIGYNVAQLEAKLVLANLVYRYRFSDVSKEPVEYDPEFLVIRPTNLYIRAVKRTSWPQKTSKASS
ncbi:cytochrome P450 [Poronia punctata]|nr:cytochrome P450 [Poronia punctata]